MVSPEKYSEDEFRKLSQHLPDLIYQFTRRPNGTYFVPIASKGIINIFGCTPEDVKESFDAIAKVIHPEDANNVIALIEESAKHLTEFYCEFRVCIPGKPVQWILSRSSPEQLPEGYITWYGFNANITKQKELLEISEAISKKQDAILKAIPDLVFEIGIDKIIYDYHSQVNDLLAAPPELFLGKKFDEVIPKDAADILMTGIQEADDKGLSNGLEYSLELPHGKFWFALTIAPIQLLNLTNKRFIVLSRNITEKKIENDKMQQLSHAVEQSSSSIVITNLDGNLEYVNQQFIKVTGYSREEVIGFNPRILNSGYTKKEDYKVMWDTIKAGGIWHGEFLNKKKNGSLFWEEVTISPVRNKKGDIINFLAIKTDITKQKKEAEKLRKITWNQNHQVRGPLTNILGIVNIIKLDIPMDEKIALINQLEKTAKELDEAIHKLVIETSKPI